MMQNPRTSFPKTAVIGVLVAAFMAPMAAAGSDASYVVPRTPEGTPDLQGVWTNASVTVLERRDGLPLVLTEEEARAYQSGLSDYIRADVAPSNPDAGAPEVGGDPGGYNGFWLDPGLSLGVVNGEIRSSWIVDPVDGKLPFRAEGRALMIETHALRMDNYDNPETRHLGERCMVSYGSNSGPPMLNILYNNHYQFVQTPDHVVIQAEMIHDARIIPIDAAPPSDTFKPWMGTSTGHWQGDTLVVKTSNFHPDQTYRKGNRFRLYMSSEARVTERFTRVSEHVIHYEFTVDDTAVYTQPWTGEMSLTRDDQPIYEYACHEGNYALPGVLGGARYEERAAAEAATGKYR